MIDAIEQDVAKFQEAGVHGLVLDLRGNSGGRIDVGTRLLGHFLPPGSSIYEEIDRSGENRMHFIARAARQYDLPLVVLVDGGTASMGEIFASAVQEHGAATILGTNTSGSVAAAQVFGLPDGAGLQVTVFEILSAEGKPLNKVGVVPDEVIEPDPAAVARGDDPVLSRAIEILHDQGGRGPGARRQQPLSAADDGLTSAPDELTLAQVMLPEDANPRGNVHGGTLMKLADTAGGVCATRHARRRVVTVVVDSMTFEQPVYVGNLVVAARVRDLDRPHEHRDRSHASTPRTS